MDNTDHLHPNWKALATAHMKWKVFVQAQPEIPLEQKEKQKKIYMSLDGEDAKKFYEELVEDCSHPSSSVDHKQLEIGNSERAPNLDKDDCDEVEENSNQKWYSGKKECPQSIHKAMKFAQNNDSVNLREMVTNGFNVNAKDEYGWSLLMVSACAGAKDAVQLLLEHKARTGARDSKGNTAIYLATMKGHRKIVDMLINCSKKKDSNYQSPEDVNVVHLKKKSLTEEFFCDICQKTIKESTKIQHETSIVHQFKLGMGANKTMYGIPPSNKGYQLLVNQGWDTEKGLGPQSSGTKFPVKTVLKRDREGLGNVKKDIARVTHFGPADTDAVERVCKPGERVERHNTLSRRERKKQKTEDQRKEIEIRRMLNEPDY
ncbi:G patch domain and ankyrin repeat-containing protein 1-like [Homarus americanus]|uniref:G patch domain and ankyrin repeat-containing protein 1-like n=1 Tax=Homarus americanus TaxID=6706 RepID=A0A8J5J9S1_HOMAM|nr:G patch domain and ankyrin repeat-containing protein 1-like [Homarus americanus]